jgi:hypothetical protein
MTVQHVHVAEGGQAIVGNVNAPAEGVGARKKPEVQPHALGYAPGIDAAPNRSGAGYGAARRRFGGLMHGAAGGAPRGNRNALKHGSFTAETLALKRESTALARIARETLMAIG